MGRRTLELSNLEKVLFPSDGITKAAIIDYLIKAAPAFLRHVKGRPLSMVRFPDGVGGEMFFQKNRPDWAPDWLDHKKLGGSDDQIDYVIASEEASLVWLGNLACLEIHQMHCRAPRFDNPDYFVFDLDPPEGYDFLRVIDLSFRVKKHLEDYGYTPFVKTTGGKGLHVIAPVSPEWSFDEVFQAAEDTARPFVEANPSDTTLHIKKESRKGKVLIDIYRNRTYQTIISAYSLRGRDGAPVAMPLTWERLREATSPLEFNLETVPEMLATDGDAWESMDAFRTDLHTKRKKTKAAQESKKSASPKKKESETNSEKSKNHSSEEEPELNGPVPEPLEEYAKKRKFEKTPEPPAEGGDETTKSAFVIHRHHASHLHYDLRLEKEGTLKSWAVPKGMPPYPGVKRLAVQTEDHPIKYLDFHGTIPKGQYGAGEMWIFARGKYDITKDKKDGFYFRLSSPQLSAEYRMIHTKPKEWLLERVDRPQADLLSSVEPMLSHSAKEIPSGDYLYEVKWDGIRAIVYVNDGKVRILARSGNDITELFPEIASPDFFRISNAVFDCEIVCLDTSGRPVFHNVIKRLRKSTRALQSHPAVCYAFDCLYVDGRSLLNDPLYLRREWLADSIRKNDVVRVSEEFEDGAALFEAARAMGLEGVMAKERMSRYFPGKRTSAWIKVKTRSTMDCLILGYTHGGGERSSVFGALQIGQKEGSSLVYRGKVGTGFDDRQMKEIFLQLKKMKGAERSVKKPLDDANTVWIEPLLFCEVQYASLTPDGLLREPVFLRLRPDLSLSP